MESYNVQNEVRKILDQEILNNPRISKDLPANAAEYASKITLTGTSSPSIPINWRFTESITSLKALESIWVNELLAKKYGVEPQNVTINTDHASLFFMSVLLCMSFPSHSPPSLSHLRQDEAVLTQKRVMQEG